MNSPNTGYDKQKLHALASSVIDGNASESQLRELTNILQESPSARDEYLALVDLHALLATDIATAPPMQQPNLADDGEGETIVLSRRRWIPITVAAALATCLLIAVGWFGEDDPGTGQGALASTSQFATIAQGTDAVWVSDVVAVGDRIGAATLRLKSGIVRLEFDSGVEVTLEGPAEFKLVDVTKTRLANGLLTATVPLGAEGFTVDTPSAQVIDLGTSFGIDIGSDGFSNVSVFDGEVEVAPLDATEKRLLTEGQSIRIGTNSDVQDIGFDLKPFEKMWPTASGIASSTESICFVPPWPKQIRFVQSDDQIFVCAEGPPVQLKTELKVNITEPSDCSRVDELTPATLEANQPIRSYILHYSPETQLGRRKAKRVTGSITFAHPVLGIMVNHEELSASSRRFGRRGAGEANQRRELNLTGDQTGDRIALSEDRKTVTLDLVAPGRTSDLVRVIVQRSRRNKRPRTRGGGFRSPK